MKFNITSVKFNSTFTLHQNLGLTRNMYFWVEGAQGSFERHTT